MQRAIAVAAASLIGASVIVIVFPVVAGAAPVAPYSWLPWQYGYAHRVSQGNGDGTHTNLDQYAWDFAGSYVVRAARSGSVTSIKDDGRSGLPDSGCGGQYAGHANFVKIYSGDDGKEALYLHLAYGSVSGRIALNQYVDRYAPIGVSDSTGWVCGPGDPAHLHYQVQYPCSIYDCQSVASSFLDASIPSGQNGVPVLNDNWSSYNSSFAMLIAENSQNTYVARGNHLRRYDLGGTGPNMFSGAHALGSSDFPSAQITALAANSSNLFIGFDNGQVLKTDTSMYSLGYENFTTQAGITSLAVNANYLYVGFDVGVGTSVSRVVKTSLCGVGPDMCQLTSYPDGTCCSQNSNWKGYQDWSTSVGAIAINGSYSYTSLAVRNSVCKDDNMGRVPRLL